MAAALLRRPKFASTLGRAIINNIRNEEQAVVSIMPIRNHWNKDWKPGPYPKTEAERIAAAKKYNLIPEDYKPFPEDAEMGDYPNLPLVPTELKDPYESWDFQVLRKNYGEPLHHEIDYYGEDRLNPVSPIKYSYPVQIMTFLVFVIAVGVLGVFFENARYTPPVLPKQMPGDGRKHYTFELSE